MDRVANALYAMVDQEKMAAVMVEESFILFGFLLFAKLFSFFDTFRSKSCNRLVAYAHQKKWPREGSLLFLSVFKSI